MKPPPEPHYRHQFPAEIICHAVWLYHVFSLSPRHIELFLAECDVVVSYETVQRWCKKLGASFADRLRRRRQRPGDKWHIDEVFIRIRGVQHYLWRAVDQDGLASTDATTRAAEATVQIDRTSPGLPLRSFLRLRSLPSSSTPTSCSCLSRDSVGRFQTLAPGDVRLTRSMIGAVGLPSAPYCPREVNVTMPRGGLKFG
jgi:hypothetical protein